MLRKKVNMYLDCEQLEKLKNISKDTGAPLAELVRRSIDAYLKTQEKTEK